jgi:hypothetical protein
LFVKIVGSTIGWHIPNSLKAIMKMNMPGLSLAAISVWLSLAPAWAQQEAQAIDTVTVTAQRYRAVPQEFREYEYEYEYGLSNGESVRFSRRVGRFYVTIKGQPPVEIFSTASDRFVTREGARLVFTENGDKLTIDRYEALAAAAGLPSTGRPQAPQ